LLPSGLVLLDYKGKPEKKQVLQPGKIAIWIMKPLLLLCQGIAAPAAMTLKNGLVFKEHG
jgi:hypothetical protein